MKADTKDRTTNYPNTQLFIGGSWQNAKGGKVIDVVNPANNTVIGHVSHAEIVDLDDALSAAEEGAKVWRNTSAYERSKVMLKAAELLRSRAEKIGPILTMEQGKPLAQAISESVRAAGEIEWAANEALRTYGRVIPPREVQAQQFILRQPVGPVALFTPWNFPINQLARKIAPALAAGCSIIAKAPEETPAAPAQLIQAFADAGLPPGVLNLVFGNPAEISSYLISHPVIRKVSFTGSVPVGKQLAELAGRHMKRVTMELGGHAPLIVHRDADIAKSVQKIAAMKIYNSGQTCAMPNRLIIHADIYQTFIEKLSTALANTVVGNGLDSNVQMGPLANRRRLIAMEDMVSDALAKNAHLILGGRKITDTGNFFEPTLIADAPLDCIIQNVEAFGPIAVVSKYHDISDAVAEANRLPYGLAAYAFTTSLDVAKYLANEVECGSFIVNDTVIGLPEMPFGGVKDSGYGAEGGNEGIDAYMTTKLVYYR